MNKLQRILVIVLAAQLALAALVFWPRTSTGSGQPLLANFTADQVVKLSVSGAAGEQVSLEKVGDGWVVSGTDGFAAETSRIEAALEKLVEAKRSRQAANTAETHKRLQVAEDAYLRRVALSLADGSQQVVYIGSSPATQAAHARVEGEDAVFLVSNLTANDFSALPSGWIDTLYLDLSAADPQSLAVTNANGTFELNKDESGNWKFSGRQPGEELQATRITSLVTALTQLRMSAPVGTSVKPEYGLDNPQAVAEITALQDGAAQTYTVRVGAQDPASGEYYALVEGKPYVVRITAATAQSLTVLKREDFVRALPTATAPVYP